MALYAIGDTHLSLTSNKPMDVFGGGWAGYVDKLRQGFACVGPEDTVVLCGDLSWGMSLQEAREDFAFLDALPGKHRGDGCLFHHPISTGLVQEAYDGKTARGLWYCISQETLPTSDTETDARWYMEKLAIDFLKEDGQWKIWHVVVATDLQSEAGTNYMEQPVDLPDEENHAFVEFGTPTLSMRVHNERYNWLDNYPPAPVPYMTFDEDNSYGPEGHPDHWEVE